jgi:hypothetical protein
MEIIIRTGGRNLGKLASVQEQFLAEPYKESEFYSSTNLGNDGVRNFLLPPTSINEEELRNFVSEVIKKEMRSGGYLSKISKPPTPIHSELNTEYVDDVEKLMERDE